MWDELRRAKEPPAEAHLRELWRDARGGDTPGHIDARTQRGDAKAFLTALGGLAAVAKSAQRVLEAQAPLRARIYHSATTTRYGEQGQRILAAGTATQPETVSGGLKRARG